MKILEKGVMVQPGDDPSVLRKMIVGEKLIFKGDLPGHDFHGNQYTGGAGSETGPGPTGVDHERLGNENAYREGRSNATSSHSLKPPAGSGGNQGENRRDRALNEGHQGGGPKAAEHLADHKRANNEQFSMRDHLFKMHNIETRVGQSRKWDLTRLQKYHDQEHAGAHKSTLPDLAKGDVAGHEFHGNQWTGGGGAASDHAYNAMKESGVLNKQDGVKANLTRKHFESVAMSLKRVPDEHRAEATRIAAAQLKTSNPLFNSERFSNAVEGRGSKAPGRMGHTKDTAAGIRQSARNMGRNAPEPEDRKPYNPRMVDNMTAAERNRYQVSPSAAEIERGYDMYGNRIPKG